MRPGLIGTQEAEKEEEGKSNGTITKRVKKISLKKKIANRLGREVTGPEYSNLPIKAGSSLGRWGFSFQRTLDPARRSVELDWLPIRAQTCPTHWLSSNGSRVPAVKMLPRAGKPMEPQPVALW